MAGSEAHSARVEAERLVATALAMARLAAQGQRHGAAGLGMVRDLFGGAAPVATGEPACCVCPICRAITAMRDPSPEFAERLATGAGDFAAGVTSLLRALAPDRDPTAPDPTGPDSTRPDPAAPNPAAPNPTAPDPAGADQGADPQVRNSIPEKHDPPSGRTTSDDEVWRQATRTRDDSGSADDRDVWSAATNAPVDVAGAGTPPVQSCGARAGAADPGAPGAEAAAPDPRRTGPATPPDPGLPG
ncbi:hypothetical protein [Micromonospora sp. NBC_01813]|uniref:hypothetical protein n=1 Tax=Micromonospora sp. NBC_01813 TaxID=2975988 RepID=UPI002DD8A5F4|nr:hypothetical protein [Micromonospora sp. NBC_01813]WSA09582.1 hypothetical protein OG958_01795 [Micromonospora sp. NBC_01813]